MRKRLCIALSLAVLIAGCSGKRHYSSSLMDYLYPNEQKVVKEAQPTLKLPLKVGIAFVPDNAAIGSEAFSSWKGRRGTYHSLGEKERMDMMASVADEFRDFDFIEEIELIPSAYLSQRGGFDNLQQVSTMYDIDVIALLSYDQVQHTDEGLLSISYWTIVGAYVIQGEKNSTNTLIDAAILHIPSKNLLFRAPGKSFVKGSATPVNLDEQLRNDAVDGFNHATKDMISNLQIQLDLFQEKIKRQPDKYNIETKAAYKGTRHYGSSVGSVFSLIILAGICTAYRRDKCGG